jgi:hypothetical protein
MTQPGSALSSKNRQIAFTILRVRRIEVLFQVFNHSLTRIPVSTQEGVVVAYAVETLTDDFLAKAFPFIAGRKGFYCAFLVFDVLLDVTTRTTF